jgi:hypothetical protein
MSFVSTQTFDFKDVRDELQVCGAALEALRVKDYALAQRILIARMDHLQAGPDLKLKQYDPREARV